MTTTKTIALIVFCACGINLWAQKSDSTSMHPAFSLEYTGELQTNFDRARGLNLLHAGIEMPLSKSFKLCLSTISTATTSENSLIDDLQGFSNIDAENIPLALTVAGISWNINDHHHLYAGVRRIDEDYFCSDAIALFTNSSCGAFPTLSANVDAPLFPNAALGIHYSCSFSDFDLKASIYNGTGHHRFSGHDNVFRLNPSSDGLLALLQGEYHHTSHNYYVGASIYNGKNMETDKRHTITSLWTYTEQGISDNLTLIAAASHALGSMVSCRNFYGLGATYSIGNFQPGLFSDYTRIDGVDEWATELTCDIALVNHLSLQPALHVIYTGGNTHCTALMRLNVAF